MNIEHVQRKAEKHENRQRGSDPDPEVSNHQILGKKNKQETLPFLTIPANSSLAKLAISDNKLHNITDVESEDWHSIRPQT